jgi:hypothetical protein
MKMKLLTAVAVLAVALGATSMALADTITVGLQEAGYGSPLGSITTVATGSGTLSYMGSYGTFSAFHAIQVNVTGTPPLPEPELDSQTVNVSSSSAGVLVIYVTEQGLTDLTGINSLISSFTANSLNGHITSVLEATYIDPANGLWGGSALGSKTFTAIGSAVSTNATPSISGPFSLTEVYTVTATGAGDTNDTIDIAAVTPEPATLSLVGMGLLGLLGLRKKRVA